MFVGGGRGGGEKGKVLRNPVGGGDSFSLLLLFSPTQPLFYLRWNRQVTEYNELLFSFLLWRQKFISQVEVLVVCTYTYSKANSIPGGYPPTPCFIRGEYPPLFELCSTIMSQFYILLETLTLSRRSLKRVCSCFFKDRDKTCSCLLRLTS